MTDDRMTDETAQEIAERAYAQLRAYPDKTLAQIVIADTAVDVAEKAMTLISDRNDRNPIPDIDVAARLLDEAQELLRATVLAARLRGCSWDLIGEAVTGQSGKKQTMSNRYGHLEEEWHTALLEPVSIDREAWGGRGSSSYNLPDALATGDLAAQVARLQRFLEAHRPGHELDLGDDADPSARIADYLWRLNTAIERYGVSGISAALAADLDARKARNLAEGRAYMDAAERAAGKTTDTTDEES